MKRSVYSNRFGLTILELLIAISIIALLLQLMLPAIESSRESARQIVCQNNLRQIGIATNLHLDAHGHFPTGGWTSVWVGDPNRGFGKDQPGGWEYNLLPYIDQQPLHDMGKGVNEVERRKAAGEMFATPVALFNCPSRRLPRPLRLNRSLFNSIKPDKAARGDYAANIGSLQPSGQGAGPHTYEEADRWTIGLDRRTSWIGWQQNGPIFQRSTVRPKAVTDGMSKTYLAGEKFLAPKYYANGKSDGDDQGLFVGFDRDNARSTNKLHRPLRDIDLESAFVAEGDNEFVVTWNFGSAHPDSFNMSLCDGSVSRTSYNIDLGVFAAKGSRNGGENTGD